MARNKIPGYREISEHYEHLIRSGELKPGELLPKEPDLARRHGVTRTTLRKAFAILVDKGLVVKYRGKGTFIASASAVKMRTQNYIALVSQETFVDLRENPAVRSGYAVHESVSCCHYQILEGVTTALAGYGRVFRMYYFVGRSGYDDQLAGKIVQDGALGIVGIGVGSPEVVGRLVGTGLPTVFVDSYLGKVEADLVNAANREGMREATRHLLKTVSGKVAFLGPRQRNRQTAHWERYAGFVDAHRAAGRRVDESLVFEVYSAEPEPAREIGEHILGLAERPGGLVCSDDGLAYGVLDAFRARGVAVPGEISVVGYANSVYCLMTIPTISSVAPDRQSMGQEAVTLLEKRLEAPQRPTTTVEVPTRLILRQSTLPVSYPGLG